MWCAQVCKVSHWELQPNGKKTLNEILTTNIWCLRINSKLCVCVCVCLCKITECVWEVWCSMYGRARICENSVYECVECHGAHVCWFSNARPPPRTLSLSHECKHTHTPSLSFPKTLCESVLSSVCLCLCLFVCTYLHPPASNTHHTLY